MKKISRLFPVIGLALLLVACDYNETNFPGFDDAAKPTNVITRTDSLTTADINKIKDLIFLKEHVTVADSAAVEYLASEGYFHNVIAPATVYIPLWLKYKYLYADSTSSVRVKLREYLAEEGEWQDLRYKFVLDSTLTWTRVYDVEIFAESFNASLGGFDQYSVSGTLNWIQKSYKGSGYANMSGYDTKSNANEDWLISPSINLVENSNAVLTFEHTINKGDVTNLKTNHTLWISTNYESGDPYKATWTQLPITEYPTGISWTFVESGAINFPDFVLGESNVRFAFKYLCSDSESATWEIRKIVLLEKQ